MKGQNGNCCFAIHVHHPAQQDLGPRLEILKGYQANKYSLTFLFIFVKHLASKGFQGLHPNRVAEASCREGAPGVQCLEHLDWEVDKMWSSYPTDVFQLGAYSEGRSGRPGCSCCGCLAGNGRCKDCAFYVLLQMWLPRNDLRS